MTSELKRWRRERTRAGSPIKWWRERKWASGHLAVVECTFSPGSAWRWTVRGFIYGPGDILPETPYFRSGIESDTGAKAAATRWIRGLALVAREGRP